MKSKYLLVIITLLVSFVLHSQPKQKADSLQNDSASIYQLQMTQNFQQQKIDSLIKLQIQKELENSSNSSKKIKDLEQQLQKMAAADSLRKAEQLRKIEALKKTSAGSPVAPFGDTLFSIYIRVGSFKPKDRAENITERIKEVYNDNFFKGDSLVILQNDIGYEVDYKNGFTIVNISELDALWFNKSSKQLAEEYRDKIKQAIIEEKEQNSFADWVKRISLVLVIIIGAVSMVYLINKLYNYARQLLSKNKTRIFKGISFGKLKLFTPDYEELLAARILGVLKIITVIISLYLSLPLLFYVFPATQNLTNTLLDWIISPAKNILHGIINFLPDLFTIIVIYIFTSYVVKAVRYFSLEIESGHMNVPGFHREFATPTFNIVRFVLYAFMLVIIFPYLPGSGSPAFQGVSVFLGLLISLGSSSAINNIIAGLVITYMRPFKIGDRIKIGDTVGDVVEKSMLVIKIKTIKNEEITVPNSTVLSSNTVNYSVNAATAGLIMNTTVTIGYDVPWRKMHETLINAALKTEYILKEPTPFVLQTSLDDFYVSYQLNAYTRDSNRQVNIYSHLHENIQDCCNEAGIEIMSPHYSNLRDGNTTTIPADYLSKDYTAPSFNIHQTGDK
jgi:small-conductance mechanosensitive channel/flagellar motor protein MotB